VEYISYWKKKSQTPKPFLDYKVVSNLERKVALKFLPA
jgi:hypothetical protein